MASDFGSAAKNTPFDHASVCFPETTAVPYPLHAVHCRPLTTNQIPAFERCHQTAKAGMPKPPVTMATQLMPILSFLLLICKHKAHVSS